MDTINEEFQTGRLVLRPLRQDDAEGLGHLGTDDVFEMVPEIETPFDAAAWVDHKLEYEAPPICHVLVLNDTSEIAGFIQVSVVPGKHYYEFSAGYWLGHDYWGYGYATEALRASLQFLNGRIPRPHLALSRPHEKPQPGQAHIAGLEAERGHTHAMGPLEPFGQDEQSLRRFNAGMLWAYRFYTGKDARRDVRQGSPDSGVVQQQRKRLGDGRAQNAAGRS